MNRFESSILFGIVLFGFGIAIGWIARDVIPKIRLGWRLSGDMPGQTLGQVGYVPTIRDPNLRVGDWPVVASEERKRAKQAEELMYFL